MDIEVFKVSPLDPERQPALRSDGPACAENLSPSSLELAFKLIEGMETTPYVRVPVRPVEIDGKLMYECYSPRPEFEASLPHILGHGNTPDKAAEDRFKKIDAHIKENHKRLSS